MSEGYYDLSGKAICKKCNTDMTLSIDRNFKGPKCKNPKCNGGISEAEYDMSVDIQKGPNLINFQ
jgi:hypothetical protein